MPGSVEPHNCDPREAPHPPAVRIKAFPFLVRKEAAAAWISFVILCALSAYLDAPLEGPASEEGIPTGEVKAPWIFIGIQRMLRFMPPLLAGVIIPGLGLAAIAALPWVFGPSRTRKFIAAIVFFLTLSVAAILTVWGYWG